MCQELTASEVTSSGCGFRASWCLGCSCRASRSCRAVCCSGWSARAAPHRFRYWWYSLGPGGCLYLNRWLSLAPVPCRRSRQTAAKMICFTPNPSLDYLRSDATTWTWRVSMRLLAVTIENAPRAGGGPRRLLRRPAPSLASQPLADRIAQWRQVGRFTIVNISKTLSRVSRTLKLEK